MDFPDNLTSRKEIYPMLTHGRRSQFTTRFARRENAITLREKSMRLRCRCVRSLHRHRVLLNALAKLRAKARDRPGSEISRKYSVYECPVGVVRFLALLLLVIARWFPRAWPYSSRARARTVIRQHFFFLEGLNCITRMFYSHAPRSLIKLTADAAFSAISLVSPAM